MSLARDISPPPSKRRRIASPQDEKLNALPESKENDDPSIIRIFSWNIDGIPPFLQKPLTSFFKPSSQANVDPPTASLRQFLRRHKWPQILCLQEVKIALNDVQTQNAVRRAVNDGKVHDGGPEYEVFFTLPDDRFNARGLGGKGKVYGVCSIVRKDFYGGFVREVRTVDWDNEGRISVIEIESPEGMRLSVWNIYAVNGTTNDYRDSRTGEVIGTRHDRKLAVHRRMMEECIRIEKKGGAVLIIGDLNVAPQRIDGHPNLRTFPEQHVINRADFQTLFLDGKNADGLRGVDVWRHLHPEEKRYTYHGRNRVWGTSADRVDLAVASRRLMEGMIVGARIWDSELERGPSDHVPISVDLRLGRTEAGVGVEDP